MAIIVVAHVTLIAPWYFPIIKKIDPVAMHTINGIINIADTAGYNDKNDIESINEIVIVNAKTKKYRM